jgi:histidine phosphotransfer protein HptB
MIDWARVDDLRSEIGEDDFLEVVAMFLEETDDVVCCLAGPPDLATVESRLHFLKGSALNLGLSDLATLCQNGETSAASGDAGLVDLGQVIASYTNSKVQLLARLGQSAAA